MQVLITALAAASPAPADDAVVTRVLVSFLKAHAAAAPRRRFLMCTDEAALGEWLRAARVESLAAAQDDEEAKQRLVQAASAPDHVRDFAPAAATAACAFIGPAAVACVAAVAARTCASSAT